MFKKYYPIGLLIILLVTVLSCSTSTSISETLSSAVEATKVAQITQATALDSSGSATQQVPIVKEVVKDQTQDSLVSLYERVSPGVVSIQVLTKDSAGQGSGFVYNREGYIITNEHVVEDATDVFVNFSSGMKVHGKVVADDLDSDLAVIKVDVSADQLAPLSLGDSDQVKVGQFVVAIGNPYGLSGSMTEGIISARGRIMDSLRQTEEGQSFSAGDAIQTDAAINPGNSGGPLLDLNGDVIGINRAIRTTSTLSTGDPVNSGIGFAVPINIVKKVAPILIKEGHYDYPYLGLSAQDELSLPVIEILKLPRTTGAYVQDVTRGGPADRAGLRAGKQKTEITGLYAGGDLIIAVDGKPVRVYGDLISYFIYEKQPGDKMTLSILRDGKEMDLEVTLDKRP